MAATASRWAALEERQRAVLVGVRQVEVLGRVAALEAALAGEGGRGPAEAEAGAGPPERDGSWGAAQDGIWRELVEDKGVTNFRFVRAPADYYERPLEYRMGIVGAASIHHLCKSMVMVNTKAPADLVDCADPTYSKYYMVIVQYTARLNAERIKDFVFKLADGRLGKKKINMRLCPSEKSDELTGYTHNAVSPMNSKTRIPIILSDRIAALKPDFFWLGAGEVDLKIGMSAAEFVAAYEPFVLDCTYPDE